MKKQIDIHSLHENVHIGFNHLIKQKKTKRAQKVVMIGDECYLYRHFRFCFDSVGFNVRYTKIDRDQYLTVYKFGKSKGIKGYFYKTSLLMNGKIVEFIKVCKNELFN